MPYYKRRRSSRRRRYARRSRRRPSVSRAVLRGGMTFAPRHQLLKLKGIYEVADDQMILDVAPLTQNEGYCHIPLQRPGGLDALTEYSYGGSLQPNVGFGNATGWDQYASIFQQYVVAGVSVKLEVLPCQYKHAVTNGDCGAFSVAVGATSLYKGATGLPVDYTGISKAPMSKTYTVDRGRPITIKRYINMNTLFGEIVKRHDQYVHTWDSAYTAATNGRGMLMIATRSAGTNPAIERDWHPTFRITFVYYIHALMSQVNPSNPIGFAAKAITKEGGFLGEPASDAAFLQDARDRDALPSTASALRAKNRPMF